MLGGAGILTRLDQRALLVYCNTWSYYREAEKKLSKEGMTLYSHNGSPIQNPSATVMHTARKDLMKLLAEFGMTPSSRTRVHALVEEDKDELSLFAAEA